MKKLFLIIIGIQFFFIRPSFAGISVNPVLLELSASEQEELQGSLWVTNEGDEVVGIEVQPEYWLDKPLIGGQTVDINTWLKLQPKNFKLKPGEKKEVQYLIKVPSGLEGETMAQVYFADVTKRASTAVGVITRVGVGLYVGVKGTEKILAKINDVNIAKDKDEIKFEVVVENLGNLHLRPRGKLIILDGQNNAIKELETQYGWPVFPKSKYTYDTKWQNLKLAAGKYKAKAIMECDNPYDKTVKRKLRDEIAFIISGEGQITITKEKGEENAL